MTTLAEFFIILFFLVVEAYRLDRYDNLVDKVVGQFVVSCRSLSFG